MPEGAPGQPHGPSIKNPRVYEALRRKGMDKSKAAAISNALVRRRRRRKMEKANPNHDPKSGKFARSKKGTKANMTPSEKRERANFLAQRRRAAAKRAAAHSSSGSARPTVARKKTVHQVRDSAGRRIDSFKHESDARDAQRLHEETSGAITAAKYKSLHPRHKAGYQRVHGSSGRIIGYAPKPKPGASLDEQARAAERRKLGQ